MRRIVKIILITSAAISVQLLIIVDVAFRIYRDNFVEYRLELSDVEDFNNLISLFLEINKGYDPSKDSYPINICSTDKEKNSFSVCLPGKLTVCHFEVKKRRNAVILEFGDISQIYAEKKGGVVQCKHIDMSDLGFPLWAKIRVISAFERIFLTEFCGYHRNFLSYFAALGYTVFELIAYFWALAGMVAAFITFVKCRAVDNLAFAASIMLFCMAVFFPFSHQDVSYYRDYAQFDVLVIEWLFWGIVGIITELIFETNGYIWYGWLCNILYMLIVLCKTKGRKRPPIIFQLLLFIGICFCIFIGFRHGDYMSILTTEPAQIISMGAGFWLWFGSMVLMLAYIILSRLQLPFKSL